MGKDFVAISFSSWDIVIRFRRTVDLIGSSASTGYIKRWVCRGGRFLSSSVKEFHPQLYWLIVSILD